MKLKVHFVSVAAALTLMKHYSETRDASGVNEHAPEPMVAAAVDVDAADVDAADVDAADVDAADDASAAGDVAAAAELQRAS